MLGERLKQAIKDAGVSYAKAALEIGVSEGNLYHLFKKESFDVAYLLKASQFLELPLSYFLEGANIGNMRATTVQNGDFNQVGSSNTQKIKGNKGNVQNGDNNTITNLSVDDCRRDLAVAYKENELLRSQLADKERIIQLLEKTIK